VSLAAPTAARQRGLPGWEPVAAVLVGLIVFLSVRGANIARTGNIEWLMAGDPLQHWMGWQFFRQSPFWQWPLGANPSNGLEISSSVVYSDSIPLMAMLFKAFNAWLPPDFQYFGIWLGLCFCLQALLAWRLLCLVGVDRRVAVLGCAFFAMAPSLLFRMLHGHYALVAHWMLLAGLCLYFTPRYRRMAWPVLLVLAALVHAYLLVMVWAIWVADLAQRRWLRQARTLALLGDMALGHAAVLAAMAAAGYFMVGTSVANWGYGFYRFNLLSLLDPDHLWSRTLRDQPSGDGDYEGFAFLGLGVLLLAVILVADSLRAGRPRWRPGLLPLVAVLLGLTLFAVSSSVAFGFHELVRLELPKAMDALTGGLRASGRLAWPAYYAIMLFICASALARCPRRVATALCALLLVAQVLDTEIGRRVLRQRMDLSPWYSPLQSAAWDDFGRRYRRVLLVEPRNVAPHWQVLGRFAVDHGMAINTAYLARSDGNREAAYAARMRAVVERNAYEPDALYVFENDALWHQALAQRREADVVGVVDGIRVLAPGLRSCTDCQAAQAITAER
jgi:hypothetical protein